MEFNDFGEFFGQMPPLLIFNACMVMTLLIGLMVYFAAIRPALVSRRKQKRETEQVATSLPPSPVTVSTPVVPQRRTGEYTVKLSDGQHVRAVEVLAILRDTADDRLIVQLDHTGYRTLVDHPHIKSKFTTLMKELAETIASADTPRPAELDTTTNMPVPPDLDMPDDLDLPDLDTLSTLPAAPVTPPKPVAAPQRPVSQPSIPGALPDYRSQAAHEPKITKQGFLRPPKVEFQPLPELNLAAAIETYLQHRLFSAPEYAGREIHVHSAPGGGVVIQVDDSYYDAVGDIADPEIRSFVASAIQEWQEQQ
jgi:hypothetical protein